jgi:hypothetical protein
MLAPTLGLWNSIIEFFGDPAVRALTTIVAIASAAAGFWAAIRAQKVMHTLRQEILVTQEQLLNDQWQRVNVAMLTNENLMQTVSNVVGADDIQQYRRATFLQVLANLLYQAWASRVRGTLSEEVYQAHFNSVVYYFRNRADLFSPIVPEREYPADFIRDCKRRLGKLKPLTRAEMSRDIHDYAALLDRVDRAEEGERQGDGALQPRVSPRREPAPVH